MKTRILSGLIMVPLLVILYFGGYVLMAACILIGAVGLYEFYSGFKSLEINPSYPIGIASIVMLYAIDLTGVGVQWYMSWFFLVIIMSLFYLFKIEDRKISDGMATMLGILYVVFFSHHVFLVGKEGDTKVLVWLIVLSAFGTDIMAYFSGMAFGKHKLCPKISPKKTVEGAIGGVLGSTLFCGVFGYFFADQYFLHAVIIGIMGGVFSQFGDLSASIFKRKMGIKDYGNIIPGHGGILDRFDSVLFTAPLVYYYIQLAAV